MEQLYEEEKKDEKEGGYEEIQQNKKSNFNKCLQIHLVDKYRRITLHIRLSETQTHDLRLE
jgi:hypothetical protein